MNYTEEEVKKLFNSFLIEVNNSDDINKLLYEDSFNEWFELNKKR